MRRMRLAIGRLRHPVVQIEPPLSYYSQIEGQDWNMPVLVNQLTSRLFEANPKKFFFYHNMSGLTVSKVTLLNQILVFCKKCQSLPFKVPISSSRSVAVHLFIYFIIYLRLSTTRGVLSFPPMACSLSPLVMSWC